MNEMIYDQWNVRTTIQIPSIFNFSVICLVVVTTSCFQRCLSESVWRRRTQLSAVQSGTMKWPRKTVSFTSSTKNLQKRGSFLTLKTTARDGFTSRLTSMILLTQAGSKHILVSLEMAPCQAYRVIHKWRHIILDIFWPPFPLCHALMPKALCTTVTLCLFPSLHDTTRYTRMWTGF